MFIEAKTPNWQVSISSPTAIVENANDIAQCIYTILATVKGTDPLRPTFGSDVYMFLDKPVNAVQPPLILEVYNALGQWEPRIRVTGVGIKSSGIYRKVIEVEAVVIQSFARIEMTFNM